MEWLIPIGLSLVIVGIIIVIVGMILSAVKYKQVKTEGGFIFWIGPFPIIGGATSKTAFYTLLTISTIFMILFIILRLLGKL